MSMFDETDAAVLHAIIRDHPLATVVTMAEGGLGAQHFPLFLDAAAGPHGTLRGHVRRANPLASQDGLEAIAIFQAAQAYVTPSWYPSKAQHGKVVPTWNYVVAHASGVLRVIDDPAWILAQMTELTHLQESVRERPWKPTDAPADYIARLVATVIGIEIPLARLTGKRKVSQNREEADRLGVVAGLTAESHDSARDMAGWVTSALSAGP